MACVAADAGATKDRAALASKRQRNIKNSPLYMGESLVSLGQGYKQKKAQTIGSGLFNFYAFTRKSRE
jgi:hypothetical protein